MKLAYLNEDHDDIMGDQPLPDDDLYEREGMALAREVYEFLNFNKARISPWITREYNTYYPIDSELEDEKSEGTVPFLSYSDDEELDDVLWDIIPHDMQYSYYDSGKTVIAIADDIFVTSTLEMPGIWTIEGG